MSEEVFVDLRDGQKIGIVKPVGEPIMVPHKEPEEIKIRIWGYELCNGAEWLDFLKCVDEKTKEIADLEAKLAESENEVQKWKDGTMVVKLCELEQQLADFEAENTKIQTELDKYGQRWNKLKDWVDSTGFQHDKGYCVVIRKDNLIKIIQELEVCCEKI